MQRNWNSYNRGWRNLAKEADTTDGTGEDAGTPHRLHDPSWGGCVGAVLGSMLLFALAVPDQHWIKRVIGIAGGLFLAYASWDAFQVLRGRRGE